MVVGEREAVLSADSRPLQGWNFVDALRVALSAACDDFTALGADLAKRAAREMAGENKAMLKGTPVLTRI